MCNTDPCPENQPTFRAVQCSSYDNHTHHGKKYEWVPYFDQGKIHLLKAIFILNDDIPLSSQLPVLIAMTSKVGELDVLEPILVGNRGTNGSHSGPSWSAVFGCFSSAIRFRYVKGSYFSETSSAYHTDD